MNYSGNISNWRLHVLKLQSLKNSWVGEGGGGNSSAAMLQMAILITLGMHAKLLLNALSDKERDWYHLN